MAEPIIISGNNPIANEILKQNLTGMAKDISVIYKPIPFYVDIWFAFTVIAVICVILVSVYLWFRIKLRNTTRVIIHNPDGKRDMYTYYKFMGEEFDIPTTDKDKDNNYKKFQYHFKESALETGFFGKYIEYDYKNPEPRQYKANPYRLDFEFVSSVVNTRVIGDLLLATKWKELVTTLLIIIVVLCALTFLLVAYNSYVISQPHSNICSLALDNTTINTWKVLQQIK